MNRSKHSIFNKLRKSMAKAIKNARNTFLSPKAKRDQARLTKKELKKKLPKKKAGKSFSTPYKSSSRKKKKTSKRKIKAHHGKE